MVRKTIFYFLAGILSLILLSLVFRNVALQYFLERKIHSFNLSQKVILKVDNVRFEGLAAIRATGISLKPEQGDTLVKIDTAYASVGILKLLAGRISLHDVELINARLSLIRSDSLTNYRFLIEGRKKSEDTLSLPADYSGTADRLMTFLFDKIPLSLNLRNFCLSSLTNGHKLSFSVKELVIRDHFFRTTIEVEEDSVAFWALAGRIDNRNNRAEFRLYPEGREKISIPFIRDQWNAALSFDTLAFSLAGQVADDGQTRISGFAAVIGLSAYHRRIGLDTVTLEKLGMDYVINVGRDYAELDSASLVTFNRISFHPYARYRPHPSKQITLNIHKPEFQAQDLFSSFPHGLFTTLEGIKVRGNLSWYLDFFVDLAMPDSLRFETSLDRHQFSVISYGNADLTRINGSFLYTAYDRDIPVRTFMVGPENPNFRSLGHISKYLQVSVLTSEDGGFYQHRGFLPDAFRESMITNIKEKRFARGGSTISMQLVKNVFLSRNKTIARKLEEALIVWLIENQRLSSKERMMEVYLNIIEWGPGIYGANEAARFYFSKDASRLTLGESIFLASIIPRPKWFKYSFDENGHLRESNAAFYKLMSGKMLNKGWITAGDAEKLIPGVELRGPAKLMLKKPDSIPSDSIDIQIF